MMATTYNSKWKKFILVIFEKANILTMDINKIFLNKEVTREKY